MTGPIGWISTAGRVVSLAVETTAAANGTDFGNSRLVYIRIDANAWQ